MIPEITFKDFVNNLFGQKDKPNTLFATLNPQYFPYTWEEIIDYIDRWLYNVPIYKIDVEVHTAIEVIKMYSGVPSIYQIQDIKNFELINKLKEFIQLKANEVKGEAEAKQRDAQEVKKVKQKKPKNNVFEDYLLYENEEQKQPLMEKLEQLYKTAKPKDGFIIYRALEEAGYIVKRERGREEVYQAINKRFGKNFNNRNYQGHFNSKKADHCLKEITAIKDRLRS